jgi:hypothetical protein
VLAARTLAPAPTGHKKAASSEWGGNRKNESHKATETVATAFQSFRRAADWVAPRIIHWWLTAFTVQNYKILFRCNNLPAKNISRENFPSSVSSAETRQYHALCRFSLSRKNLSPFSAGCAPGASGRNFGCLFR